MSTPTTTPPMELSDLIPSPDLPAGEILFPIALGVLGIFLVVLGLLYLSVRPKEF